MTNRIIIGDSQNMAELPNKSVHLVVSSPPYFNAPFDTPGLFDSYDAFLKTIRNVSVEVKRVLDDGRIVAYVLDDILVDGVKFPIVADMTKILTEQGFKYRDRLTWLKPEGYIRTSRRSGSVVKHPFPMYCYFDNCSESILIFQNGKNFDYQRIPQEVRDSSRIDLEEFQKEKWHLGCWKITNVLPSNSRVEKGVAAFPIEIPRRLIELYSYKGETVLDPFAGSATTLKAAIVLGRQAVGYELDLELLEVIKRKAGTETGPDGKMPDMEMIVRGDAKRLRTQLQRKVEASRAKPNRVKTPSSSKCSQAMRIAYELRRKRHYNKGLRTARLL
jgi:DNA modification methylase